MNNRNNPLVASDLTSYPCLYLMQDGTYQFENEHGVLTGTPYKTWSEALRAMQDYAASLGDAYFANIGEPEDGAVLTQAQLSAGWHYCPAFDGLLTQGEHPAGGCFCGFRGEATGHTPF